jgi:hypothetical protein
MKMQNKIRFLPLLIVVLVISNSAISSAATQIKAGSKCSKAGQTTLVASKKFTCVKSGSKLVWDKGLAILAQPLFTATPTANNYEWDVTVTNYQGRNSLGLDFSYSFAVDGGIWNLFSKTKMPKEKIVINQSFKLLEIKVAVSDLNNQYLTSPQFQRLFRVEVVPPQSISPNNSPNNPPSTLPALVSVLQGVQWRNEPGYYIDSTPASKVLFRWPKPLENNLRGYLVKYENTSMITPPCDLSKALCELPKRVDSKVYKKVINDSSSEFIVIDGLAINTTYEFSFYAVSGGVGSLELITLPSSGFKLFVFTTGEAVPDAPIGVTVG